ncbi:NAD(+) synthase [Geothrix edaphica]|uniref:Glutamine-dependent NAD(+) synthetase n=1 Tax=Geothrix edaphica TaxID=2927976 RepID=A0ABQ5PV20_9BACT|nr:NAD(+) synthase [Geothrix edaphica]GLH66198.1 NAD+ synthase [Geothrix edaphica]
MKIALLQLNARLGDPEGNGRALEAAYAEAVTRGAELVLAPELAIPGYLAEDRLWETGLRRRIERESHRLAALSGPVPLLFGTARPAPSGRLWNELWWCEGGALRHCAHKRVLPSYDIFDEHRYFEPDPSPQPLVAFRGHRIGLSICEDLWADPQLGNAPVGYGVDPIADLAAAGATLILNGSASPSGLGSYLPPGRSAPWAIPSKDAQRQRLLPGLAQKHGVPIAYASRVGAESWLLFDGGSGLALPDGRWQGCEPFHEGPHLVDTSQPGEAWRTVAEASWLRTALVMGIRDNLAKQGLEALVLGLSGGIDSAVAAALAVEALGPGRVLGVALPTRFSSGESSALAEQQARQLGLGFLDINVDAPFAGFTAALEQALPDRAFGLTDENLQSRCRGSLLMALTSEPEIHHRLGTSRVAVLNTGNKSEAATGYFTLYGDGIGAFAPLGDCLKARVYAVARELGDAVPRGVVERPPTAELRPGQTDEASLLPYAQLDAILGAALEAQRPEEGLGDDLALVLEGAALDQARTSLPRILGLLRRSEFKRRQLPFAFKVSPKAFGAGRRIPLTSL